MKHFIVVLSIIVGIVSLNGCSQRLGGPTNGEQIIEMEIVEESNTKPVQINTDSLFIKSLNGFGLNSSIAVFSTKGLEQNIIFSPTALGYTLGSISEATTGATRTQLVNTLNMGNISKEKRLTQFHQAYENNTFDASEGGKLIVANSIWAASNSLQPEYQEIIQSKFSTNINEVDFSSPTSFEAMSNWFTENSNGALTPKFKSNPEETKTFLNTAHVESPWLTTVDVLESDTFYGTAGETMCKYLSTMLYNSSYQEGAGYVQANIPLTNGAKLSFIMPITGYSLEQLLQEPSTMNEIFLNSNTDAETADVSLKFPAFTVTSTINFKNTITALGISNLYQAGDEWTGFTNPQEPISSIIQQVTLTVDENGCNFKSPSSETMDTASTISAPRQIELTINRPFLFIVRSSEGLPILTGIINDIT